MFSDNASGSLIGLVLHDSYHIARKIAQGGMGSIYEASHVRLKHKRFAIKLLHPSVAQVEEMYARFRREAEIATKLGHPNIVDVLDFNETPDGQPYMVMEFLEGQDLGLQIKRPHWLTPERIVQIVKETASALQAAHDAGVVHRDIKPANIFLSRQSADGPFVVKVLDFGISKIQRSQSIVTKANSIMGSINYMSPEQASGRVSETDHRTDIFALGAICYQMLCGQVPFSATSLAEKLQQIISLDPQPLHRVRPAIPAPVSQVVSRALAKRKQDRYDRVIDFAADLTLALTLEPTLGPGYESLSPTTKLERRSVSPEPAGAGLAQLHKIQAQLEAQTRAQTEAQTRALRPAQIEAQTQLQARQRAASPKGPPLAEGELGGLSLAEAPTLFKLGPQAVPPEALEPDSPPVRRGPLVLATLAVVGLALGGVGFWLTQGAQSDREETFQVEAAARRAQAALVRDAGAVLTRADGHKLAAAPAAARALETSPPAPDSAAASPAAALAPDAGPRSGAALAQHKRRVVQQASLAVTALVAGRPLVADVLLDGQTIGQTPFYQEGLLPGLHQLEVRRRGYAPKKQQVRLRPGRPARVVLSLDPAGQEGQ